MFPALSEREAKIRRAECPEPCQTPPAGKPKRRAEEIAEMGRRMVQGRTLAVYQQLRDASLFRPCTSQKDVSVK